MSTPYITVDKINHINAELSNYCNAACPMCARFDVRQNLIKKITNNSHTSLDVFKSKIGEKIIKNLRMFRSCGIVGDGVMNPECLQIYDFVKTQNKEVHCSINTNGGARSNEFYKEMAKIGVNIIFSIDGLEDTNHLYRKNVNWTKMMSNVESFIKAGGHAQWDFLVFKHNQHQVDLAENLSKKLGFKSFKKKTTTRWNDFDSEGNWIERKKIHLEGYDLEKPMAEKVIDIADSKDMKDQHCSKKKIICNSYSNNNVEIFLHANGNVSPCCYLGDLTIHESKNIIKDFKSVNINFVSLQEILDGYYFQEIWKGIRGQMQEYCLVTCQNVCGKHD